MMKYALYATAAAAAAVLAEPAQAALTITPLPDPCTGTSCAFTIAGDTTTSPFSQSATFTLPMNGYTTGAITTSSTDASNNIDFTRIFLTDPNGSKHYFALSPTGQFEFGNIALNTIAGLYSLTVEGTSGSKGAYGGSLTFSSISAVPEPATWGLMILGFGAVGFTMRRRSERAARMRASLKFA